MTSVFCNIGDVPKGKKRGSMKECVELGQVKYYGVKKVDQRLINDAIQGKKLKSKVNKSGNIMEDLTLDMVMLGGKIKKLQGQLKAEKNKENAAKITKEIESQQKKLADVRIKLQKLKTANDKKKGSQKGGSKKRSKKNSKKGSKRKSKKASKRNSRKASKRNSKRKSKKSSKK